MEYRITASQLRQKYFDFFTQRGHCRIASAPIVPDNDPTALFISAGMQPLVPYIMGQPHPAGRRLVNVQKCFRTSDIDQVGNTTHLTFFEMLGNWSLGAYFKREMIPWSWEFLTVEEGLALDPRRLYVTVFAGDDQVEKDRESVDLWRKQFAQAGIGAAEGERIFPLGRADNWWGPVGRTGPCGPDTEMFFDAGGVPCGPDCRPGCSCGKYVEIWNDVFMEYEKRADGTWDRLAQQTVDTGMGLARVLTMLNGLDSVYDIDTLRPLVDQIGCMSGRACERHARSFRIVADHANAACFLAAGGVEPANVERGYVLRRLIRRAVVHARRLGIEQNIWGPLFERVRAGGGEVYPELESRAGQILDALQGEEEQFERTLKEGLKRFEQVARRSEETIEGERAFDLFATYGFPLEMTQELAQERGLAVDAKAFQRAFARHQELSRRSAGQQFAGGLADRSSAATRYHTATHLLHAALRRVLGRHVEQRGSHITEERLRFDFAHPRPLKAGEIEQVESLVNAAIKRDFAVCSVEMALEQAQESGALGLFGDRYGESVRVYAIGELDHAPEGDPQGPTFSKEICGGPHVERTGLLGRFRIVREQSASRGVRRIRAVLEA